jgi:hypothetical protein
VGVSAKPVAVPELVTEMGSHPDKAARWTAKGTDVDEAVFLLLGRGFLRGQRDWDGQGDE